jgi:serine/threonine protein kinase
LKGKFTLEEQKGDEILPEAKDFVSKMLAYDPKDRISAKDAPNTSGSRIVLQSENCFANCNKIS